MKILLLIILLLNFQFSTSQLIFPGGVKGFSKWYVTSNNLSNTSLISLLPNDTSSPPLYNGIIKAAFLNNYPSLVFTGKGGLSINLSNIELNNFTFFTVYQSKTPSSENILWHFSKNQQPELVLTTGRMADLEEIKYMNFNDLYPLNPKVNTYVQQKTKDSIAPVTQMLNIGNKPSNPKLPISEFSGLIPEFILFDRVLNRDEQIRVASYLSLKYGITLSEPEATYLNSSGNIIWDGASYSDYHYNIAAIARDDSSGLFQRTAWSSNQSELLSISTKDSLENNSFLMWGDNNLPLNEGENSNGVPTLLQKKWLVIPCGLSRPITTELVIDTRQLDVALPEKPVYWLAIDRSGNGKFRAEDLELIKMSRLDQHQLVHFNGVEWNKGVSKKEVFGLIVGQQVLVTSEINGPDCTNRGNGSLHVKIWGGEPPFRMSILKENDVVIEKTGISGNASMVIPGIRQGKYSIRFTDKVDNSYTDSFFINYADAPQPVAIASHYILKKEEPLVIDAADQMPFGYTYSWKGPNGFLSTNSKVSITQPGVYALTCSKNGCESFREIRISKAPKSIFKSVTVFPNPTSGAFTTKVTLDKPAAMTMDIYSGDGKLVATQRVTGHANYRLNASLNSPGLYYIVFRSWQFTDVKKIEVIR